MNGRTISACRRRGFSLIELMISLAIGTVIVIALVGVFINSSRTNRNITKANAMVESGRYVSFLLQQDLWHAGLWMRHVPSWDDQTFQLPPYDLPPLLEPAPDPCRDPDTWDDDYRYAVVSVAAQSHEGAPGTCFGTLPDLDRKVVDTDVLIIRHAQPCVPGQGRCEPALAGEVFFQDSLCDQDADKFLLRKSSFTLRRKDCATPNSRYRYVSNVYFVRDYAVSPDDGIPTLVLSRFGVNAAGVAGQLAPQAIVEGVEAFRVEFGIDDLSKTGAAVVVPATATTPPTIAAIDWGPTAQTRTVPENRGDAVVDRYIRCTTACTNADLMMAVAARVYLLVRAPEPTPGFVDDKTYSLGLAPSMCTAAGSCGLKSLQQGYMRHLFASTFRFANVAGRRDLPP